MITNDIAQESPERARAFLGRIVERCTVLELSPWSGRPRPEFGVDVRSLAIRPIIVIYRVSVDRKTVDVLRVVDGRRDLGTIFTEDIP